MTDLFKNITIESSVDKDGRVSRIVLPISKKAINLVYDEYGDVLDIQDDNGDPIDMSETESAITTNLALYTDEVTGVDDPMMGMGAESIDFVNVADKVLGLDNKMITLEYNEEGRLVKESNTKFSSYYFLKEVKNYGRMVTDRLANIYGNMVAMVREVKLEDGTYAYDEILFGNTFVRTLAADVNL